MQMVMAPCLDNLHGAHLPIEYSEYFFLALRRYLAMRDLQRQNTAARMLQCLPVAVVCLESLQSNTIGSNSRSNGWHGDGGTPVVGPSTTLLFA